VFDLYDRSVASFFDNHIECFSLFFGNSRIFIVSTWIPDILFDFRSRVDLALGHLIDCESIRRRRPNILCHPLREFGARLGIFRQIVLIQRPSELRPLPG
jgi:hypothetical protein